MPQVYQTAKTQLLKTVSPKCMIPRIAALGSKSYANFQRVCFCVCRLGAVSPVDGVYLRRRRRAIIFLAICNVNKK